MMVAAALPLSASCGRFHVALTEPRVIKAIMYSRLGNFWDLTGEIQCTPANSATGTHPLSCCRHNNKN